MKSPKTDKDHLGGLKTGDHILVLASEAADAKVLAGNLIQTIKERENNLTTVSVAPEKGLIGLSKLREIKPLLVLKNKNLNLIHISDAQCLSEEAQNYLLKELEDSQSGKLYILSGEMSDSLLPTIVSRMRVINYLPPQIDSADEADRALYGATGYSVSLYEAYRGELKSRFERARQWLKDEPADRLKYLPDLDDQQSAIDFIMDLQVTIYAMAQVYAKKLDSGRLNTTLKKLDMLDKVAKNITNRGNIRLNLDILALSL